MVGETFSLLSAARTQREKATRLRADVEHLCDAAAALVEEAIAELERLKRRVEAIQTDPLYLRIAN